MPPARSIRVAFAFLVLTAFAPGAWADSSSPLLAAYYDGFMAICGGTAYAWDADEVPAATMDGVAKVGIGKRNRYALTTDGLLQAWNTDSADATVLMDGVKDFYAGRSGLLIVREDGSLWELETTGVLWFGEDVSSTPTHVADDVATAAVGDGANYFVDGNGRLFVRGKAHRGQYGDGRLESTEAYVQTFEDVTQVVAHTGHALVLRKDGGVWGTGGNKYGPLGRHGIGDKAIEWGKIFDDARAIATGSTHSVAIKNDGTLWIWGRNETLEPRKILASARAVAAGSDDMLALSDGALWQWETGKDPKRLMDCGP